jgi:hypothetical protein
VNATSNKGRVVVKVTTSKYRTKRGFAKTRFVEFLRRKSDSDLIYSIEEDSSCGGADSVVDRIINLNEVEDGIFLMIWLNERRDWETGNVEEWDYKLVPIKEAKP